jgi:arabinose-5-phosphate isomerase
MERTAPPTEQAAHGELKLVREVLRAEAEAVAQLAEAAGAEYARAISLIERCAETGGTVLVTGLGKSGLVGAKIAATLSSLGIPSHAVHPTEAAHGDLGRFRLTDVALCLSHSGETEEVVALAATLRQDGLPVIAITRGASGDGQPSSLEQIADVVLAAGVPIEPGGFLAPTASTTAAMAIGDALALAVAKRRNFTKDDFARRHPGGTLGGMLRPVADLLRFRVGRNLPLVKPGHTVAEALRETNIGGRRPGALLIVKPDGTLAGIFTDGDLRRLVLDDPGALDKPIAEVMTENPRTLEHTATASDAAKLFRLHRQDEIPVLDADGKPVGILDVQDLIALKLVKE